MLEPFLMLTVLNCFFMFSSTVTTCALWWQYRRHRHSCSSHSREGSRLKLRKSKSCETGKKCYMNDIIAAAAGSQNSIKKRGKSSSRNAKESKKEKKFKTSGLTAKPRSKEKRGEQHTVKYLEKLTSTEDTRERAASPSSKSTVVMEVSTVQKVVQIFEKDQLIAGSPKETVTYRFSPESDRKIEFIVQNKSGEKSKTTDKKIEE